MGVDTAASRPRAKNKPAATTPRKKTTVASSVPDIDFAGLESIQGLAAALAKSAAGLCKATEEGLFCPPLDANLTLWVAIKTLLAEASGSINEDIRRNLTELADRVAAFTASLGSDFSPKRVAQLAEINLKIGRGLIDGIVNQMIRDRAYYIWVESGRPHGRDQEHWQEAELEIKGQLNP